MIMIDDDDVKVVYLNTCIPETNINWKNAAHCFHPNQPPNQRLAAMKYSCNSTDLVCGNNSNPNKILNWKYSIHISATIINNVTN